MNKLSILFLVVLVAISTVYDFYRGGISYVIFGLIVILALSSWLYFKRRKSN